MSEIRHDPLLAEMVIIAPGRDSRPHSNGSEDPSCPFCPGHEEQTPASVLELALGASESWFVRVFANLFPIVSPASSTGEAPDGREYIGGAHEVIVETPVHDQEMHDRSPEQVQLTLMAYRDRLNSHLDAPGINHVSVFQNRGPGAGASLDHPHSQVVALSYVPAAVENHVRRLQRHHAGTGTCLLCDEIGREREDGSRVLEEQDGFLLYAPYGSARPGELILAPIEHRTSFGAEGEGALLVMAGQLLLGLTRMHAAFEELSYNLVLQTWPKGRQVDPALHWYLRIIPRRAELGGFELSTGDFVSTLSAEDAADMYRDTTSR